MQQPARVNPLLAPTPAGTAHARPVLDWDIRRAPRHTARVAGHVVSSYHLTQFATQPGIVTLRIISDLLSDDWIIVAHNPTGVTIEDVMRALQAGLHVPLTQPEWECMSPVKRARIEHTFYERCEASSDFDRTRYGGVRRIDCLLHTTVFAGLSSPMLRNNRWEVVLTLSRNLGARHA